MSDEATRQRELIDIVAGSVTFAGAHDLSDLRDESLHDHERQPFAVARPHSTLEVAELARWATQHGVPVTARGSGTGLSGGATPVHEGLVICFDQMSEVLRVDEHDHVAVVQAGVTIGQLNERLRGTGLHYPVYPGALSGSLGGNVNTNAGGMRAVRHGVTRHHVLGLEVVLIDGTVLRTGGPVVKSSSGYDLTQLIVGSEGTLALVTEVTLKLSPVFPHSATLLAPFAELTSIASVVSPLITSGLAPSLLEYLDALTMSSLARFTNLNFGVDDRVANQAAAYLVVVLETRTADQLGADLSAAAAMLDEAGALEVYVLDGALASGLIEAREKAFWLAKAAGANDIVDVVVPRSKVPQFLGEVGELATASGAFVAGCGHVGDGNVHLSVYLADDEQRRDFLLALYRCGVALGGAISGEHGLGVDKRAAYLALAEPTLVALQRRIKEVFDPQHLLNPYRHLDPRDGQ